MALLLQQYTCLRMLSLYIGMRMPSAKIRILRVVLKFDYSL